MKLATACLALLLSCGKSSDPRPQPTPAAPTAVPRPATVDIDLDAKATGSVELPLDTRATNRTVAVREGGRIGLAVTHVRGELARVSIEVFEPAAAHPFSSDAMACAEPGCTLETAHTIGPNIRWITVKLAANGPTTVRLAASRE